MKIAFTICSNNYLAQAKTLGDSIKKTNPDYQFYIGLADTLSDEIDYPREIGHPIIPSAEIGIPAFDSLWKKYSIIEFNTCVKPFYFQYFINQFPDLEYLFYLDPDTFVYDNLSVIEQQFGETGRTLLTPHILTPIDLDNKMPNENQFLIFGIYNLGFLGLKYPKQNSKLLEWWKERTFHLGYNQISKGLFVDQIWFNLAIVFFEGVIISKHPGLNMAPWNLHERTLSEAYNIRFENELFPLVFYHFSNYKHSDSDNIGVNYNRYNLKTSEELKKIYKNYHETLLLNGIMKLEKIKCYYMIMREQDKKMGSLKKMCKYYMRKILPQKLIQIINTLRPITKYY